MQPESEACSTTTYGSVGGAFGWLSGIKNGCLYRSHGEVAAAGTLHIDDQDLGARGLRREGLRSEEVGAQDLEFYAPGKQKRPEHRVFLYEGSCS